MHVLCTGSSSDSDHSFLRSITCPTSPRSIRSTLFDRADKDEAIDVFLRAQETNLNQNKGFYHMNCLPSLATTLLNGPWSFCTPSWQRPRSGHCTTLPQSCSWVHQHWEAFLRALTSRPACSRRPSWPRCTRPGSWQSRQRQKLSHWPEDDTIGPQVSLLLVLVPLEQVASSLVPLVHAGVALERLQVLQTGRGHQAPDKGVGHA